jgi:hypothetical protein
MASSDATARRDALVERLFGATIAAMDLVTMYIGVRLGLYRALADSEGSTAQELAEATGLHERYVREWLEQQATTGILEVGDDRCYTLPAGHDEALLDETSVNYIAPTGKFIVACVRPINAVLAAFRSGEGVPYADYGADLHEGQAEFTRPMFEHLLGTEWLPAIDEIHTRLQAEPPAQVADVACGEGFSTMAIARAYPRAHVHGIDLDDASIEAANRHLVGSGLEDRVTFHLRDAADAGPAWDLRPGLHARVAARHVLSRAGPDRLPGPAGGGRIGRHRGRAGGRFVLGARRRHRAALLRLQRAPLSPGRDGR